MVLSFNFLREISTVRKASEDTRRQILLAEKEEVTIQENLAKLSQKIQRQKIPLMKAEQVIKNFQDMIREVLDLARRGNENARRILPDWDPDRKPLPPGSYRI